MPPHYAIKDHDVIVDATDKAYVLRVRDLVVEDRPREKLLADGPDVLTTSELLAVVLNIGTKKEGILTMVSRVAKEYGEKNVAHEKNPRTLSRELKIPLIKACQIVACFELGRRFFQTAARSTVIRSARQAYEYLHDMRDLPKEHLRGIYLNSRYKVIHDEVISIGSLTANIVHPREVFRPALEFSAAAVIIAHNHPSGVSTPTREDVLVTEQLRESGKILGIDLLDHLVITKNGFVSVLGSSDKAGDDRESFT